MTGSPGWNRGSLMLAGALLAGLVVAAPAAARRDRAARDFPHVDADGNGRISRVEWHRRGNFDRLDRDRSGDIDLGELRALYTQAWTEQRSADIHASAGRGVEGRVDETRITPRIRCALGRFRGCGLDDAVSRGLLATGLGPRFPAAAQCRGIDDYYALDYSFKRRHRSFHGGIDIPAPRGTAMIAAAAGTVVAIFRGEKSARGIEVVVRHSPAQTGLPVWVYTAYGHLDTVPPLAVGQPVAMGQVIGPTGHSGISPRTHKQSRTRRPAIHFAAFWSESGEYAEIGETIIAADGHWLDPVALYRGHAPFESQALARLPEQDKWVDIPVMFEDGSVLPVGTRTVWPYSCRRE